MYTYFIFIIQIFDYQNSTINMKTLIKPTQQNYPQLLSANKQTKNNNYIIEYIVSLSGVETQKVYIKHAFLGRGGFANCYITQLMGANKFMATKIIEKINLKSSRTKLRLISEIKIHKTFSHPNIVQFLHYFQDYDNVYIMLELCENESLNQLLKERGTLTVPQVQSFIYGICNGLKYLHEKKFIHRDLKLGNIFLNSKFQIKIGDFGLTSQLEFLKENKRTVCGTPNYIAPEVLQGIGYYFEVDVWGVGIIMYTLLYGFPPFQSQNTPEIYGKIRKCQYKFPKNHNIPIQAINLIKSILVPEPEKRPSLDEIMNSPFMKLGSGIPLQLPQCCYARAPSKAQIQAMPLLSMKSNVLKQSTKLKNNFISPDFQVKQNKYERSTMDKTMSQQSNGNAMLPTDFQEKIKTPLYKQTYRTSYSTKNSCHPSVQAPPTPKNIEKKQEIMDHIIDFFQIDEKAYYFCTNKYVIGTYEKDRQICFIHFEDLQKNVQEIHQIKLYNNLFSEQGQIPYANYRYKMILNLKSKQLISTLRKKDYIHKKQLPNNKSTTIAKNNEKMTFITRINAHKDMIMLKLSNKSIQILYEHTKDGFLYDIRMQKLYYFDNNWKQVCIANIKQSIKNYIKNSQKCHKVPNIQTYISVVGSNQYIKISMIKLKHIYGIINQLNNSITHKHNRHRNSQ